MSKTKPKTSIVPKKTLKQFSAERREIICSGLPTDEKLKRLKQLKQ